MPAVRGIAEGGKIGVVGRGQINGSAWADQTIELLHGAHDVAHVFDDVRGVDAVEAAVTERIRKYVEVGQYVGAAIGIAVNPDSSGKFIDAAANVQSLRPGIVRIRAVRLRHSSLA